MDLIHIGLLEVVVPTLPTDNVEGYEETKDAKAGRATPVHKRVAKEEILNDYTLLARSK